MIFELRIYHIAKGKAEQLHKRFKDDTFELFEKHQIQVCDFWQDVTGKSIYYICVFDNEKQRQELWGNFKNDEKWIEVKSKSEKDGPLVDSIESIILNRADYIKPNWH